MSGKVWTPKEIKQKDVVVFDLPVIKRPVTTRMLRYFIPSFVLSVILWFLLSSFRAILVQISIACMMLPFLITIILCSPKNGRYIEDIVKTKINYKTKSSIVLNEKALRARRNNNVKG